MGKCSFEYPVDIISDTLFLDDDQKEEHNKREYALMRCQIRNDWIPPVVFICVSTPILQLR